MWSLSSHLFYAVFFEAWILQILLSEVLGVPTTVETGTPDANVNLYDPESRFEYGKGNDWSALETASELVDCRLANRYKDNYESWYVYVRRGSRL